MPLLFVPQEKMILDIIQSDFPLVSRPYALIGEKIGLTEAETLAFVRALEQKGAIRRIGANFHSRMIGWKSTLCAASVPESKLDDFVALVNKHAGVTHNYLRRHTYNVWFTYIGATWEKIERDLEKISLKTGIPILNLPAKKMYKIQVDFRMQDILDE
jgi:DNA-binding Lrp family transcriptional regulator